MLQRNHSHLKFHLLPIISLMLVFEPAYSVGINQASTLTSGTLITGIPAKTVDQLEKFQAVGIKKNITTLGIGLNAAFIPIIIFPLIPTDPRITFNDSARTLCYYRNNFFEKSVRASYELMQGASPVDPLAVSLNPFMVEKFGGYFVSADQPGNYTLHVQCDGAVYDVPVTVPSPVTSFQLPDIKLNNAPPVILSLQAQVNGSSVSGATKNTVIKLVANATDANSDKLSFTWAANAGKIVATSGNTAQWHLPNSTGLNFAYVLVSDGKGGFREKNMAVSTDVGTVPASAPSVQPSKPSDKVPLVDHFLTFYSTKNRLGYLPRDSQGADSKMGSCRYYVTINAADGCDEEGNMINPKVTFSSWKQQWGLTLSSSGAHAIYANKADLNLERDMHGISNASGTAFYVCNYPRNDNLDINTNLSNAINNKNLVACVAMEYSPTPGVNRNLPFTKFLTFAPSGNLLQSVNLDTRGEKYIPGSCVVCHGANKNFNRFAENGTNSPNLNAQFLPFDLNNFAFSGQAGLTQASQELALHTLNNLVLNTKPTPAIVEVIKGWYPLSNSKFNGLFVPPGWIGNEKLYNGVVKPHCRTCHVAATPDDPTTGLTFKSYNEFNQYNFELDARVCGNPIGVERKRYSMPNSLITFDRFWKDFVAQNLLRQHLITVGELGATDTCNPPN